MRINRQTHRFTDKGNCGKISLVAGAVCLLLSLVGLMQNPEQFFPSYLVAYSFWLSLGLGALFFVLLQHLTGAVWSIVLRRIAEALTATLPAMVIFFLPVWLGRSYLYAWCRPDALAGDHLLQAKSPYLNSGFFLLRAAGYFLIWWWLARSLYRISLAQDTGLGREHTPRLRSISAAGMILFAFTCTFAAVDWLMSLDAHWYSTIFGVYFFAGAISAVLPGILLLAIYLRSRGILHDEITREHYHDLGKLTFAFMILWSYMAFSQYFLMWYANLPEETLWYRLRWEGGWAPLSVILPLGHFVVPFVVLMSRAAKRNLKVLTFISFWLLALHWLDLYWIILPNFRPENPVFSWMDATLCAGLGGLVLWLFWKRFTAHAIVPVGDPKLADSLKFINQ